MWQLHPIQELSKNGPPLIATGMAIVLVALLWPGVPIAAAVLLIGYGAMLAVVVRPGRQDLFAFLTLAVYAPLGCLAVAAQTHAAINGPTGHLGYLHFADHLLATAMLVLLIRTALRRLRVFST